jgi:hypothetical protein
MGLVRRGQQRRHCPDVVRRNDLNVQNAGTSGEITAIASSGDTLFAATDDSALLTSDLTGVAWTTRSQNFAQSSFEEFTNVVWSGSEFAAISDAGRVLYISQWPRLGRAGFSVSGLAFGHRLGQRPIRRCRRRQHLCVRGRCGMEQGHGR